jgi:4-hydroxybenzoate polyprenyltransferase
MAGLALVVPLGLIYLGGVAIVALLLAYEQSMVAPDDLSRAAEAFNLNGYVGILYMMTTAVALYVG